MLIRDGLFILSNALSLLGDEPGVQAMDLLSLGVSEVFRAGPAAETGRNLGKRYAGRPEVEPWLA